MAQESKVPAPDLRLYSLFTQKKIEQADPKSPLINRLIQDVDSLDLIFEYADLGIFESILKKYYDQVRQLEPLLSHRSFGAYDQEQECAAKNIFRHLKEILGPGLRIEFESEQAFPLFEHSFYPPDPGRLPLYHIHNTGRACEYEVHNVNLHNVNHLHPEGEYFSKMINKIVYSGHELSNADRELIFNELRQIHTQEINDHLNRINSSISRVKAWTSCFERATQYFLIVAFSLTFCYIAPSAGFTNNIFGGFTNIQPDDIVYSVLIAVMGCFTLSSMLICWVDHSNIPLFPRDHSVRNVLTQAEQLIEDLRQEIKEYATVSKAIKV